MVNLHFERLTHGHDTRGAPSLATKINGVVIPDFEFDYLKDWELDDIYGWENVAVACYVRRFVKRSGHFMIDTLARKIATAPPKGE